MSHSDLSAANTPGAVRAPGKIHLDAFKKISGVMFSPQYVGIRMLIPGNRLVDMASSLAATDLSIGSVNCPVSTALGSPTAEGHSECSSALCPRAHLKNASKHATASACVYFPARMMFPVANTSSFPCDTVLKRICEKGDSGSSADSCWNTGSSGIRSIGGDPSTLARASSRGVG